MLKHRGHLNLVVVRVTDVVRCSRGRLKKSTLLIFFETYHLEGRRRDKGFYRVISAATDSGVREVTVVVTSRVSGSWALRKAPMNGLCSSVPNRRKMLFSGHLVCLVKGRAVRSGIESGKFGEA